MSQQPQPHALHMPLKEIAAQRERFQRAPEATDTQALPLREKQAIIDEILRGMPIKQIECYEQTGPGGKTYMITKGWAHFSAIIEFMDDGFATWNATEKREWEQGKRE